MKVSDILKSKGGRVMTVRPGESVSNLAQRLRLERVGALIVSENGQTIEGIISERDVAHGLAEHGANLLEMKVSNLMTRGVVTCSPDDTIAAVARVMTNRRVRHLPVQSGGNLVGIISVGDVVKHRIDEVEMEANVLRDYAVARH